MKGKRSTAHQLPAMTKNGGDGVSSEEGLDPSSAFANGAANNSTHQQHLNNQQQLSKIRPPANVANDVEFALPRNVLLAQQLAHEGNIKFGQQKYTEAIHYFTEAIKLDPQEVRFFGNRGFCFEILGQFEKALEDADVAISITPSWPKGYYRKACALERNDRLEEAERAFSQVLRLDADCVEAQRARYRVMAKQLANLGLSVEQSEAAVVQYGSVKAAASTLIPTRLSSVSALSEVFDSDDDDAVSSENYLSKSSTCSSSGRSSTCNVTMVGQPNKSLSPPMLLDGAANRHQLIQHQTNADPLMDPRNPLKWPTLWVGNLCGATNEKMLTAMFERFGKLRQLQLMLDKHCAFITFIDWKSAAEAMREYQGKENFGQRLLIKFPDRALEGHKDVQSGTVKKGREPMHSAHRGTLVLRKAKK